MKKSLKIIIGIIIVVVICYGIIFLVDYIRVSNAEIQDTEIQNTEIQDIETKGIKLEELPENYTMEKAIEDGCFVITNTNEIYNKNKLDEFIAKTNINAKNRQEAFLRVVAYTDEGDTIIKDISFNIENDTTIESNREQKSNYIVKVDNTRDKWSAPNDRKIITLENFPGIFYGIVEIEQNDIIEVHLALYAKINYVSSEVEPYKDYFICAYSKNAEVINSFYGKVIESNEKYIIVEPNEGEDIRKSADKISIGLGENNDAIYAVGTNVKITYDGEVMETYPAQIKARNIELKSVEKFNLVFYQKTMIQPKQKEIIISKGEIKNIDYNVYAFEGHVAINLNSDNLELSENSISLREALLQGKITMDEIIAKANKDLNDKKITGDIYKDGGSMIFQYENYTIIKCHSLDGNRDVYIGTKGMTLNDII